MIIRSESEMHRSSYWHVWVGIGLTVIILFIDINVPWEYDIDFLFIFPLLLAQQPHRMFLYMYSTLFIIFATVIGKLISQPSSEFLPFILFNSLLLSLCFIAVSVLNYLRQKGEHSLRSSEEESRTISGNVPNAIVRIDKDMNILYANPAAAATLGVQELRKGTSINDLPIAKNNRDTMKKRVSGVFATKKEFAGDIILPLPSGEKYMTVVYVPEPDENGRVVSVLGIYNNVTEIKLAEKRAWEAKVLAEREARMVEEREGRIKYLSYHDKVTGLYNWSYFDEEIKRLDTERQWPISIIMADVNNLKLINDVFGHREGDRMLRNTADIMKQSCRDEDIIARWDGDEIVILLPKTEYAIAKTIGGRIKSACQELKGHPIRCKISVGISSKDKNECCINDVIKQAEDRMYKNKVVENAENREMVIRSMLNKLENIETRRHLERLKTFAERAGESMGLSRKQLGDLILFATLHDVGKTALPEKLLEQPSPLSTEQWSAIRKHPELGAHIVHMLFPELTQVAEAIMSHHERWDGSGYPKGLKDDEIPLLVRILSILDAYDTMTHERSYKKALTDEEAIEELKKGSGKQFDPELVELFINAVFPKEHIKR